MQKNTRVIVIWLSVVCFSVFAMVVVGGITRLTDSGLSMVDWKPLMGVIPPLNLAEWQDSFEKYKQFPEYELLNRHMDLDGFKKIFYWEYSHRILGRLIGFIFFIPFLIFLFTGIFKNTSVANLVPKLVVALGLGGLQGLMGWYMVMSGLVDVPHVSHFRLAAHLLLALLILAYIFWLILELMDISPSELVAESKWLPPMSKVVLGLILIQVTYGAFTAGLRAGFGYNTFPMMNGQLIADAVFMMTPWWLNLFDSSATIQFVHRWLGVLVFILVAVLWMANLGKNNGKKINFSIHILFGITLAQFLLGILTLVFVVPLGLASLHQGGACVLVLASIYLVYLAERGVRQNGVNQYVSSTEEID